MPNYLTLIKFTKFDPNIKLSYDNGVVSVSLLSYCYSDRCIFIMNIIIDYLISDSPNIFLSSQNLILLNNVPKFTS
jgi:hypothetical protein